MKSAGTALETLKQRRSSSSEDAKASARQKVEQLKARIRMLQMMATTDPKGTARLAAQLARELGAAVKAYAAAGGNATGLSATSPPAQPVTGETEAAGPVDAGVDVAANVPAESAPEPEDSGTSTAPDDKAQAKDNPYQKAIDAAQADLAERSRNAEDRRADKEFMSEAKRLANELKSALRRAAEALQRGDEAEAPEQDEAEKAIRDVEREIESHPQASPGTSLGISITV